MHINIVNEASNTCGANIQWSNIFLIINNFAHFELLFIAPCPTNNNKQSTKYPLGKNNDQRWIKIKNLKSHQQRMNTRNTRFDRAAYADDSILTSTTWNQSLWKSVIFSFKKSFLIQLINIINTRTIKETRFDVSIQWFHHQFRNRQVFLLFCFFFFNHSNML